MPSALDALDFPYSFSQTPTLTVSAFLRAVKERGVTMTEAQLQGLHRRRLLVPLWRYTRSSAAIIRAAAAQDYLARQLAGFPPESRRDLVEARATGRLFCALDERFMSSSQRRREHGELLTWMTSEYLYSSYQLNALPLIEPGLPALRYDKTGAVCGLEVDKYWRLYVVRRSRETAEVAIWLSVLEGVYRESITRTLKLDSGAGVDEYDDWRRDLDPTETLAAIGVDQDQLTATADGLLTLADQVDPLKDWLDLVAEVRPGKWERLGGTARQAIDLLISAELIMRLHDELTGIAGPPGRRLRRGQHDRYQTRRLQLSGHLDPVLTEYGLSPHPRLLLIVEGETEHRLFPRVMDMFDVTLDPRFIAVENAATVNRDLTALIAYASALRVEPDPAGRFLSPNRPLTRVLVVMDPEGKMRTVEERARRRKGWIDRLMLELSAEHRTDAVRSLIEQQIHVRTWNTRPQGFEFAHFSDRQLAVAIMAIDGRQRHRNLPRLIEHVARARSADTLKDVVRSNQKVISPRSCGRCWKRRSGAHKRGTPMSRSRSWRSWSRLATLLRNGRASASSSLCAAPDRHLEPHRSAVGSAPAVTPAA